MARYDFTIKHITGQYFNDQHKQIVLSKGMRHDTHTTRTRHAPSHTHTRHDQRHDPLMTDRWPPDLNGFNSGIMALRCSEWNLGLFRRIWDSKRYINDVWAEQRGLIAYYNSDPDVPHPS